MAGHKELIKKLSEDDSLRQQILDTPTREGKQEAVRNAGLEVPDHHDVLQEVAGGMDDKSAAVVAGTSLRVCRRSIETVAFAPIVPVPRLARAPRPHRCDDVVMSDQRITDVPRLMTAAYITDVGPPEVIRAGTLPVPDLGAGEVLVGVDAVVVNRVDTFIRSGRYPTALAVTLHRWPRPGRHCRARARPSTAFKKATVCGATASATTAGKDRSQSSPPCPPTGCTGCPRPSNPPWRWRWRIRPRRRTWPGSCTPMSVPDRPCTSAVLPATSVPPPCRSRRSSARVCSPAPARLTMTGAVPLGQRSSSTTATQTSPNGSGPARGGTVSTSSGTLPDTTTLTSPPPSSPPLAASS